VVIRMIVSGCDQMYDGGVDQYLGLFYFVCQ
jgi:hypothetical protein